MAKYYKENPYEYLTKDSSEDDELSTSLSVNAVESYYILPPAFKIYNNSIINANATEALRHLYNYNLYESNVGNWIDVAYSIKTWVDADYQKEYENENKHYVSQYENVAIKLSAGKNADITIIKNSKFVNNPITIQSNSTNDGIYVEVGNKIYVLPLNLDIAKVHDLVMVYNYAVEQKDENLVNICEQELFNLEKGKQKEVQFVATDYISQEEKDYIQQQCEYYAAQKALVENKIIPPQSMDIKFETVNDLFRFTNRVSAIYKRELQNKLSNPKRIERICKQAADYVFLHPEERYETIYDTKKFSGEELLKLKFVDKLSYQNSVWSRYELDSKQWNNQNGNNFSLRLATGKYSYIDVCQGYKFDNKTNSWEERTGVFVVIGNKRISLPLSVTVEEVANMLRYYEIILSELAKDPKNELYQQYKKELEQNFVKVSKGELTKFPFPKCHYDLQISKKQQMLSDYARFLGIKTQLIKQGKIPAETDKNKYKYRKNYMASFRKLELKNKNNDAQYE